MLYKRWMCQTKPRQFSYILPDAHLRQVKQSLFSTITKSLERCSEQKHRFRGYLSPNYWSMRWFVSLFFKQKGESNLQVK